MPGFKGLFVPGPTNMPFAIRQAMDVPLEDHRAPDYPQFLLPLLTDVKKVFQSRNGHVFIFPGSGTGGWESAISNTLSPGDKVLASIFGQFSLLWVDMCQRFGLEVDATDVEWGKGVPLNDYRTKLEADKKHEIKAVLVTHNETATGVASDVAGVRRILDELGHPALLFVDGVSSIASIDFRMDDWGVDVAVCGSQKGFMMPTGLTIVCVSEKALKAGATAKLPRCYFDYKDMAKNNALGYTPLHPGGDFAAGPARLGRSAARGRAAERHCPSPSARRRGARRGRSLGPAPLRARAGMVFRHGHRGRGAGRRQRQRRHQDRVSSL